MSDIFISYAREDLDRVALLSQALARQGWDVFWDRTIPTGKTWRDFIGAKLDEARCVVVVWSQHSVKSEFVREEADVGRERGILAPVLMDRVRPPLGFGGIQAADLSQWDGASTGSILEQLFVDIGRLPGLEREQERERQDLTEGAANEEARHRAAEAQAKKRADGEARRRADSGFNSAPVNYALTRTIPNRSTASLLRGIWFVFRLDGHKFALWTSNISGREEVYVDGKLIVPSRKMIPSLAHTHNVRVENTDYAIAIAVHVRKLKIECTLAREGELLLGLAAGFTRRKSLIARISAAAVGVIAGSWAVYFEPPLSLFISVMAVICLSFIAWSIRRGNVIAIQEFRPPSDSVGGEA